MEWWNLLEMYRETFFSDIAMLTLYTGVWECGSWKICELYCPTKQDCWLLLMRNLIAQPLKLCRMSTKLEPNSSSVNFIKYLEKAWERSVRNSLCWSCSQKNQRSSCLCELHKILLQVTDGVFKFQSNKSPSTSVQRHWHQNCS